MNKKAPIAAQFAIALVLLATFFSALSAHADATWIVQVVDDRAGRTGGLCLALDSTGTPHMAYVNSENGSYFIPNTGYERSPQYIMYTRLGEEAEVIDRINQPPSVLSGKVGSLALDLNFKPHIIYSIYSFYNYSAENPNVYVLRYATLAGTDWNIQQVDQGTSGSLALDSAGNPHIAYAGLEGDLKYASWTGQSWSIETVDSRQSNPGAPFSFTQSVALDAEGHANIIYQSDYTPEMEPGVYYPDTPPTETTIKWARRASSGWTVQNVSNVNASSLGNMVLDADGYPHFSYVDAETNSLVYEYWNGVEWIGQTVTPASKYSVRGNVLTLDSEANPHVAYWDHSARNLTYARLTWSGWEIQNVATLIEIIGYTLSLELDSEGNPHIGYMILRHSPGPYPVDGTVMYATSYQHTPTPSQSPSATPTETPSPTNSVLPSESPLSSPSISASPSDVPGQFGFSWVEVALAVAVLAVGGVAAYFLRRSQKPKAAVENTGS